MLSDADFLKLCEYCKLDEQQYSDLITGDAELSPVQSEPELTSLMQTRSARDSIAYNFLAAGCYSNFIPAVIRAKAQQVNITKSLFANGLNKQSENMQHCIQQYLLALTAMPYCSLFEDDLTTLLANLLVNAVAENSAGHDQCRPKVLVSATISPAIRNALRTQLKLQQLDLVVVDYEKNSGCLSLQQLEEFEGDNVVALVLAWPNFFGLVEDIEQISNWAKNKGCLVIGLSNPVSLSLLESPFVVTDGKLDFLLGELQPLGLSQHGSSPAFLASGKPLSTNLQAYARAQNQISHLPVIQSYIALSGVTELNHKVQKSNQKLALLVDKLMDIPGISLRFSSSYVNECVIQIEQIDIEKALKILAGHNMVFGCFLQHEYPELANCLLIYCSDQHSENDVEKLVNKVATVVKNLSTAGCPVKPKFS